MKALTVRNVPDELYVRLASSARANRRSLQQQILAILDQAVPREPDRTLATAAALRARLAGRALGDTVDELRQERKR